MYRSQNSIVLLADQAKGGDSRAQGELRRKLESEMIHIVRRVMQCSGRSSLDRRILAEAGRIGLDAKAAICADGEHLMRKVAHCVSARFVEGMCSGPLDQGRIEDTVCS